MDEALVFGAKDCKLESCQDSICYWHAGGKAKKSNAETRDRAGDLQIFSLRSPNRSIVANDLLARANPCAARIP